MHRSSRRLWLHASASSLLGLALAPASTRALAQPAASALPKGTLTLVVPFAAGGATDVVSRLVAQKLGERIQRGVVVENLGGGGGAIGAAKVARAVPDGHTLLMGTIATHVINPLTMAQLPYNAQTGFTPISLLATVPNVLLVHSSVKARNVQELIALVKAQPGKFGYGTSGVGTPPHLSGELLKSMAGLDMGHVPYKGGGPAMSDLVAGHIPILFDVLTGAAAHIRAGSVRALAVTTRERVASFPDIPTMAEAGVPGYETWTWNAIFGPAGMPRPMVDELSQALQAVLALPDVQAKLKELSATPVGSTPEALATLVKTETDKWRAVIQSMGGLKRD
ncbi:tripartite tricarboxylate transporter substrate binding protein [Acidovorax sp. CCYZU-2555]|uniref:Bug family tripartite tricarboxylate transporter substrate binding protein n=1 Tax=Acidovorax sp. CCYZU-2555 TaxID=2835042 RepID=UPI001BCC437D|nr:tripartite tricarboxylate transporter substrate binding protein [Acidovorax sp. CCYZU-2555]MBS7781129.1 tripartite tricarboxylate transporter substrate binding protein [Acidovorax sp. CCYZU-2555]